MAGYDFIVVGGGSAGCAVAARLSEDPAAEVLLLEAGPRDRHPLYGVPAGFAKMTKGLGSWGWDTVPQRHMRGKIFRYTQAKVLGGGSSINAQIYTRGNARDYDGWERAGCDGWGYRDVLPHFLRAEDNDVHDGPFHARGGPLGVSMPAAPLPICEAFFEAAAALGIPRNADVNAERQDGVAHYQLTQRRARRASAASAYIAPNRSRPNLTVRTGAEARRLLIERGRAAAVEMAGGERLDAACEIVLCSGAIGSARLLQLSGIGPADMLRDIGVQAVLDAPQVGANLQDHLDLYCICELSGPHSYDRFAKPHLAALAGLRYLLTRTGPAASSLFETGGFWYADPDAEWPDVQLHLGLGTGIEHGVASMPDGGVTLNACHLRPRSRGSVRLRSADPAAAPLIDPNYLADPLDRRDSLAGLRLAREIMAQAPLKGFVKAERLPGPGTVCDEDLFDFVCTHSKTSHHCAGTCRMGLDEDAVVDLRLRFNGIDGLRVADNSIMPTLISSNTNAAAIMIGERAAEMIREDHGGGAA